MLLPPHRAGQRPCPRRPRRALPAAAAAAGRKRRRAGAGRRPAPRRRLRQHLPGEPGGPPRGSILALYTDGLVEERGSDIDLGIDGLRASLAHAAAGTLDELADQLLRKARHSPHRSDDIALLLTHYRPE
ncbi:SpoIIE family protein phosphatase [Kitasatospora aburaviensis]